MVTALELACKLVASEARTCRDSVCFEAPAQRLPRTPDMSSKGLFIIKRLFIIVRYYVCFVMEAVKSIAGIMIILRRIIYVRAYLRYITLYVLSVSQWKVRERNLQLHVCPLLMRIRDVIIKCVHVQAVNP